MIFNFQMSENIFLFLKVNNLKNNICRVNYISIFKNSFFVAAPCTNGGGWYWTRLWFPWKLAFTEFNSPWPPDDPGENSCTQQLSLHSKLENNHTSKFMSHLSKHQQWLLTHQCRHHLELLLSIRPSWHVKHARFICL